MVRASQAVGWVGHINPKSMQQHPKHQQQIMPFALPSDGSLLRFALKRTKSGFNFWYLLIVLPSLSMSPLLLGKEDFPFVSINTHTRCVYFMCVYALSPLRLPTL